MHIGPQMFVSLVCINFSVSSSFKSIWQACQKCYKYTCHCLSHTSIIF